MVENYNDLFDRITIGPSKSLKCKKLKHEDDDEIENTIELKKNNDNKYEKIEGNLFKYEGTAVHIIYENDKPWFRAKDVATILEYKSCRDAIIYNVDNTNKKKYEYFQGSKIRPLEKSKYIQKNTVYINKE